MPGGIPLDKAFGGIAAAFRSTPPLAKAERLVGGKADGRADGDFDATALAAGVKVEREHTDDPEKAKEIAKDHLAEDPQYYEMLARVERKSQQLVVTLEKAGAPHKYLERKADGRGGWKYKYRASGALTWKQNRFGVHIGKPKSDTHQYHVTEDDLDGVLLHYADGATFRRVQGYDESLAGACRWGTGRYTGRRKSHMSIAHAKAAADAHHNTHHGRTR